MATKNKPSLGVICTPRGNATEKNLFPILKEKFNLVLFPIQNEINFAKLKDDAKNIRVVLNTAGDMPNTYDSIEIAKTLEGLGKLVIDSTKSFYYREDKWKFYQICLKHGLPTPTTYYIPRTINFSRADLRKILDGGPVVFKGIFSDTGRAVKRAMDYGEALKVLRSLRKLDKIMPIIAQRYIPHGKVSYRVTMAGNNIIQAIIKSGKNWKEGKLFYKNEKYRLFKPDKKLTAICKKAAKAFGITWCGLDFVRDAGGKWHIIEINSCPSMDFVLSDMKRANTALANYFLKLVK
ncbi:MAG: ATP-grasp domain-containing protein [DPANN group archaeon]|nr:ATP-grasp domain-containing protein [DPANN group archaeon]